MDTTEYITILEAIQNKQQVICTYQGYYRELCPYKVGYKNGREQALFLQFGGESSQGTIDPDRIDHWRCMEISQMEDVESIDGEWYDPLVIPTREGTCLDVIEEEVDY